MGLSVGDVIGGVSRLPPSLPSSSERMDSGWILQLTKSSIRRHFISAARALGQCKTFQVMHFTMGVRMAHSWEVDNCLHLQRLLPPISVKCSPIHGKDILFYKDTR
jgi:hypothetical protein